MLKSWASVCGIYCLHLNHGVFYGLIWAAFLVSLFRCHLFGVVRYFSVWLSCLGGIQHAFYWHQLSGLYNDLFDGCPVCERGVVVIEGSVIIPHGTDQPFLSLLVFLNFMLVSLPSDLSISPSVSARHSRPVSFCSDSLRWTLGLSMTVQSGSLLLALFTF